MTIAIGVRLINARVPNGSPINEIFIVETAQTGFHPDQIAPPSHRKFLARASSAIPALSHAWLLPVG
jgi:hypothetical protein